MSNKPIDKEYLEGQLKSFDKNILENKYAIDVVISNADYQALTEEEKNNGKTYFIYDLNSGGSGGSGTTDYNDLSNKPSINGVTLSGNKTLAALGLREMTDDEIVNLINNAKGE